VSSPRGRGTSLISDRNMPFCLPGSDGAGCRRQWSMTISPHVGWCGSHPSNIFPGMYRFAPSTGPTNSRGGPDGGYSIGCSIATTIVVGVGDFGPTSLRTSGATGTPTESGRPSISKSQISCWSLNNPKVLHASRSPFEVANQESCVYRCERNACKNAKRVSNFFRCEKGFCSARCAC
jgi:hypothetical protein